MHVDYVVVGVIANVLDYWKEAPAKPVFYVPRERVTEHIGGGGDFMIRSSMSADSLRNVVRQVGQELSGEDAADFFCVEAQLEKSTAPRRVFMWLLSTMGGVGLLLSALGVYAVMAYAVVRRTREIGVRMALGATQSNVARMVLGHGGRLVLDGMVLGVVAALIFSRYLESLLYQLKPGDPWAFVGVLLALGTVAGVACYIPARRAAKVDPMVALRYE
jgi:ABC-type lipoprotein release transport system permease subunit